MAALSEPSMSTESTLEPSYSSSANKEMNSSDSSNANAMSIDQGHQLTQNVDQSHLITIAPASTQPLMSEHTHDALDALASLASGRAMVSEDSAQITPHQTSSDDDDSESMPPPPPREPLANSPAAFYTRPDESTLLRELPLIPARLGRLRSASNPEGMEKWDSYSRRNDRQHFVLPSSILEEELASTRRVLGEVDGNGEDGVLSSTVGHGFQFTNYSYYDQSNVQEFTMLTPGESLPVSYSTSMLGRKKRQIKPTMKALGASSDSVTDAADATKAVKKSPKRKPKSPEIANKNSEEEDEEEDESLLEPEELLRRARSRLLEDLSEGAGEKGVLTLPHSLGKYKEVYNKNGRIGIYTPSERAAIITKFNAKRARRVWNKKIRYNCRKNLADRRMRIKGRFVKRSVEAVAITYDDAGTSEAGNEADTTVENDDTFKSVSASKRKGKNHPSTPPTSGSPLTTVDENEESHDDDEEMPDVDDEEAGFSPTDDMPYRRTRRYTIT